MKHLIKTNPKTTLFCLGCLSALAMAPVYAWPLMMVGYSALLWFLTTVSTWKQVAVYAFLFFFGYFLTSLYWISSSLFVEIDKWWWALPFSFAGLPFVLALFPAMSLSIASLAPRFRIIFFIIALIAADIARGYLFTGFPWNLPAHTWLHSDLMMATLPYIGFWGLNALTVILFCFPLLIISSTKKEKFYFFKFNERYRSFYLFCCLCCLIYFYEIPKKTINQFDHNIIMVQANIPQHEKWNRNYIWRNFDRHIEMSLSAIKNNEPQIIIWPETAISESFVNSSQPQRYFKEFLESLPQDSLLISGYLNIKNGRAHNSIAVFNRDGEIISKYDKHHLVPFGEYMPFGLDTVTGFNNFSAGSKPKTTQLDTEEWSFVPLICYESVFPQYLPTTTEGSMILNLTNDSWFGNTAGPYQHFDHMIFRAIETKAPALRLSGNGISAIINNNGAILKSSRLNKTAIITNNQ